MAKKKAAKRSRKPSTDLLLSELVGVIKGLVDRVESIEKTEKTKKIRNIVEHEEDYDENQLTKKQKINLFDKMPERNMHKEDTEIDRKLWSGKQPSERTRQSSKKEMSCSSCKKMFDVFNPEMYLNSDFVCNDCIAGKRRG